MGGRNLQGGASVCPWERGRSEKPMLGVSTWSWRTSHHGDNCILGESACGLCSLIACRLGIEKETLDLKRGGKSAKPVREVISRSEAQRGRLPEGLVTSNI